MRNVQNAVGREKVMGDEKWKEDVGNGDMGYRHDMTCERMDGRCSGESETVNDASSNKHYRRAGLFLSLPPSSSKSIIESTLIDGKCWNPGP